MVGEWREARLGELVQLQRMLINPADHPDELFEYYSIPAYDSDRRPTLAKGSEIGSSKFAIQGEAILVSKLNPRFPRVWHVAPRTKLRAIASTEFLILKPRDRVDSRFIKYLCLSPPFQAALRSRATGTSGSHQRVSINDVLDMWVLLPPLPEQRAIAHILGTLDDKIELNRRMSQTLEEMARALFKAWFVDFEPVRAKMEGRWHRGESLPGLPAHLYDLFPDRLVDSELGEIPEGWEVTTLGELLELAYGKALKAEDRQDGPIPVFGSNGQVGWHNEKLVTGPGIIVGRKGNPGVVKWVQTDFFPIDTTFYVVPKEKCPSLYFLFFALAQQDLASLSADSAVPGLNRNLTYMNSQILPPRALLVAFDTTVEPLFRRVWEVECESRSLAALRDALLPKLIRGEIRVKDAERFLKERGL